MAIGALAGALNTMYASVASRREEITTLRILGFSGTSVLSAPSRKRCSSRSRAGSSGPAIGCVLFDGMQGATMSGNFTQAAFRFAMTTEIAVSGAIMPLAVGLIGSLPPTIQAVPQKLVDGLAGS